MTTHHALDSFEELRFKIHKYERRLDEAKDHLMAVERIIEATKDDKTYNIALKRKAEINQQIEEYRELLSLYNNKISILKGYKS